MATSCNTATCMRTEHTPRTRAPGELRVYTRQHAHTQRGACVNTNAHGRWHTRLWAAQQARRPTHAGRLRPWPQGSSEPTPRLGEGGLKAGRACPVRPRPGASSFRPPAPLSVSRPQCRPALALTGTKVGGPRILTAQELRVRDSGPRRGRAAPPAHSARAAFPGAA